MVQTTDPASYFRVLADALAGVEPASIELFADALSDAWAADHKILVCGNGGSASTASHMATDLTKQTLIPGRRPMRAISLTANAALLTAWGNDAGFARIFAEQVITLGEEGDVLVCISCSGNSANIDAAIIEARRLGMQVLGLGGFAGGSLAEFSDAFVHVPSHDYGIVESAHLAIEHCIARMLASRAAEPPSGNPVTGRPAVFLDRDGVINRNVEGGVRSWADFEFLPGALAAIARLTSANHQVIVVTNQANIGRGIMTRAQVDDINRRMCEAALEAGGRIDAVMVCDHRPEEACVCRKPQPGLLIRAAAEHSFSLPDAFLVGDHETDIAAARAAGARAILVLSGRGSFDEGAGADAVVEDLESAVEVVLGVRIPSSGAI